MRYCRACGAKTTIDNSHKINADILESLNPSKLALSHPSQNSEDLAGPMDGLKLGDKDREEEKKEMEPCELFSNLGKSEFVRYE
jgi:hypothetical protein